MFGYESMSDLIMYMYNASLIHPSAVMSMRKIDRDSVFMCLYIAYSNQHH